MIHDVIRHESSDKLNSQEVVSEHDGTRIHTQCVERLTADQTIWRLSVPEIEIPNEPFHQSRAFRQGE